MSKTAKNRRRSNRKRSNRKRSNRKRIDRRLRNFPEYSLSLVSKEKKDLLYSDHHSNKPNYFIPGLRDLL